VLDAAGLDEELEDTVFDALQRKSVPDLSAALVDTDERTRDLILALVNLHGDETVLAQARELYSAAVPAALDALDALTEVAVDIKRQRPGLAIYFDLAELRGYHYHTGLVFAAYALGRGEALANGGRYNDVGAVFGRARPATGFAADLKALMALLPLQSQAGGAISVPDADDPALQARVEALRAAGEIVINCLSGAPDPRCDRELQEIDGEWRVESLDRPA
ncbi:MAG: ATP phosphoribosyltransferase regulatory subunit, partial [Halioglobus sp.]|nr:ATP phosphoribosyltransferase regulatory subunit [Halioglobus sp.]